MIRPQERYDIAHFEFIMRVARRLMAAHAGLADYIIWLAKSGFGGTEYLLSGVGSEGSKRGMSYNHMAELLSWKPAQRFGLLNKGDISPGLDADMFSSTCTTASWFAPSSPNRNKDIRHSRDRS